MDADADADSPWHEVARSLAGQDAPIGMPVRPSVVLDEFAGPALLVNGEPVRPRIKKSYLLLAFLLAAGDAPVPRDVLLDALFDGRTDASARSYLRQAAHQLREVLPDDVTILIEGDRARLVGARSIQSEYARVEDLLARSAHAPADTRGRLVEQALAIVDRGRYLGKIETPWVEERRERLARRAADARHDAAKAAFAAGRFQDARRQAALVVEHDPYRESSWRLLMRIASALGDENGVIDLYRRCERALGELGTRPAATTHALLQALRK